MNPNIQKHIGSILVALAGIGTELLGKTGEPEPATTGEPTDLKPKRGRPASKPAETSAPGASLESTETKQPDPAPKAPAGAKTWEELKDIMRPMVMGQKDDKGDWVRQPAGDQAKKLVDKYLPEDRKGQGLKALSEFPQHHGDFTRDVEAFLL